MDPVLNNNLNATEYNPLTNGRPVTLQVVLKSKYIGEITFDPSNGKYILNINESNCGVHSIAAEKIDEASSNVQCMAEKVSETIVEETRQELTDEEIIKILKNNFYPYIATFDYQAIKDKAREIEEERNSKPYRSSCFIGKIHDHNYFDNNKPDCRLILAALQYMVLTGKIHKFIIAGPEYCLCFDQRNIELPQTSYTKDKYDRKTILQLSQNMTDNMLTAPKDTPEDIKPFVDEIIQNINTRMYNRIHSYGSKMFQATPLKIDEVSFHSNTKLPPGAENKALNFLIGKKLFHSWITVNQIRDVSEITVRFDSKAKNWNISDTDNRWNYSSK